MPLRGFTCPAWAPTAGTQNELSHCLGTCPHQCVSPLLLNAMWRAEIANHHKGSYISASMLSATGCPRQTVLERAHGFYEVPTRRWWPFRGTIIHAIIEQAGVDTMLDYGWLQELRMSVPLTYDLPTAVLDADGVWTGKWSDEPLVITMGGTTDGYNCLTRELHDFKSMADIKAEMFAKAGKAEDKWVTQLNVYRWLVANTPTPANVRARFPDMPEYLPAPETLVIQGIGMMAIPRTGRSIGMKVKGRYTELDIETMPVLPLDELEAFIRTEALKWYRWLILGEMPPVVPVEDAWLCASCPFNGHRIAGGPCLPNDERDALTLE